MNIISTVARGATAALGFAALAASPAFAAKPFSVSFESEAPGLQATSATFSAGGVESFDARALGNGRTFVTDFGTGGAFSGTYTGVDIINADQYGGAGGSGRYPVSFSDSGYTLDIASSVPGGANYFGYWLSALDNGNQLTFYRGTKLLFTFNPQDVRNAVNATGNPSAYYGNPNSPWRVNRGEPYLFVNFFNERGRFDRIVFTENPRVGGYESDNHTVGRWLTKGTGTEVAISGGFVPEPETWAMLMAGFGMVGLTMRRRKGLPGVAA